MQRAPLTGDIMCDTRLLEHNARVARGIATERMLNADREKQIDRAASISGTTLGMIFVIVALLWLALLLPSFLPWYSAIPPLLLLAGEVLIVSSRIARA